MEWAQRLEGRVASLAWSSGLVETEIGRCRRIDKMEAMAASARMNYCSFAVTALDSSGCSASAVERYLLDMEYRVNMKLSM